MSDWIARTGLGLRQLIRSLNRRRLQGRRRAKQLSYAEWIQRHDALTPPVRAALAQRLQALPVRPLISVLLLAQTSPSAQPQTAKAKTIAQASTVQSVQSVLAQLYPAWELCWARTADAEITELAAQDTRLHGVPCARHASPCDIANALLQAAQGEWVVTLHCGDTLSAHSLLLLAEAIMQFPRAGLIYADEDQLDAHGQRHTPYFKPDWNADLALAQPLTNGLTATPRRVLQALGGYRPTLSPAHVYDLTLRCTEELVPDQIVHIPHVLCHRQPITLTSTRTPTADQAQQQAVREHLQRRGITAHISAAPCPAMPEQTVPESMRVQYPLPTPAPLVSIIIPTRNQVHLLRKCIDTLTRLTHYPNYEVIVVDNGSDEPEALRYIETLKTTPQLRVMHLPLRPFNYSALNNRAAEVACGELLVLMNNDIEIIDPDWLREMVSLALRPGVGAVGARLLYPDGSVQHAGVILGLSKEGAGIASPAHKGLAGEAAGHGQRAWLMQSYSAVTAACLVVRKALFDQVGGLDETNLAVAYNDVDFCLKLRALGLSNVWTPYATLIHHESISRGRDVKAASIERFKGEAAWMRERWGNALDNDPAYNPNLNAITADFALANPPRVSLTEPWFLTRPHNSVAPKH